MASTRHDDWGNSQQVKVTREIPLWGLVTLLGMFAAQAVGLYYTSQRQGQQLETLVADVKTITHDMNKGNVRDAQVDYQILDLQRRIAAVEAALAAAMAQQRR